MHNKIVNTYACKKAINNSILEMQLTLIKEKPPKLKIYLIIL